MNKRNPIVRQRTSTKHSWGKANSKILLDFSKLEDLGNIVISFEGLTPPTIDNLISISNSIESYDLQDSSTVAEDDTVGGNMEDSNGVKGSEYNNSNRRNNNSSSSSSSSSSSKNKRKQRGKSIDTNLGVEEVNSSGNVLSSNDRAREFFIIMQSHYGEKFKEIADSCVDSMKRFIKAEISEMAMLSINRNLFHDAPYILEKFYELCHRRHREDVVSDEEDTDGDEQRSRRPGKMNGSRKRCDDYTNRIGYTTNHLRSIRRIQTLEFLGIVRDCLEPRLYQNFLDLMVEMRVMFRLNRYHLFAERLQLIKSLFPRERDDLRNQIDKFFPNLDSSRFGSDSIHGANVLNSSFGTNMTGANMATVNIPYPIQLGQLNMPKMPLLGLNLGSNEQFSNLRSGLPSYTNNVNTMSLPLSQTQVTSLDRVSHIVPKNQELNGLVAGLGIPSGISTDVKQSLNRVNRLLPSSQLNDRSNGGDTLPRSSFTFPPIFAMSQPLGNQSSINRNLDTDSSNSNSSNSNSNNDNDNSIISNNDNAGIVQQNDNGDDRDDDYDDGNDNDDDDDDCIQHIGQSLTASIPLEDQNHSISNNELEQSNHESNEFNKSTSKDLDFMIPSNDVNENENDLQNEEDDDREDA